MHELFGLSDGIDLEEYVIATYYVGLPQELSFDILKYAAAIAVEQSTGTWVAVPEETPEVRRKHVAKVVGIYEAPSFEYEAPLEKHRNYILQIAFPHKNFGPQIPMLLSTVIGNISMAGRLKLLDLNFPLKFLKGFKGPKFGISGVRRILGVEKRPLLNNMIKPNTGISPKVGAKLFYEAALGGADIVKDDELLANPEFSRIEDRVTLFMEACDRADSEKKEKTLYTVNITDEVDKMLENAERAQEHGANALMINYLTCGISALRVLSEDESVKVPILAHMDFAGAIYSSPFSGMSSSLILAKLPRLCGADIVVFPAPYGKAPFLKERYLLTGLTLQLSFKHIERSFPMPSGGINPSMVPQVI
ncbi:MAG: RuBisCO large subunit C-terminal-like domain-containing protein, partial [Candidatus Methanofastidiosia archaeon]